jgi:hypothetical protein
MGAGVSSMNQMREALISRADELRQPGETLDEFFEQYTYRKVHKRTNSLTHCPTMHTTPIAQSVSCRVINSTSLCLL